MCERQKSHQKKSVSEWLADFTEAKRVSIHRNTAFSKSANYVRFTSAMRSVHQLSAVTYCTAGVGPECRGPVHLARNRRFVQKIWICEV